MNEYWRFIVATIIGTILGVVIYRAFGDKKSPMSSSIGIALGGAGMGALFILCLSQQFMTSINLPCFSGDYHA